MLQSDCSLCGRFAAERHTSVRRNKLLCVIVRCLGSGAAATGVFLLIIAAVSFSEGWIGQWSGYRELNAASPPPRDQKPQPSRGQPLAKLEIPRLKIALVVREGSDDATLKKGPGHIEETAFPGELGNVGIAGHRDSHFRPLRNIRKNDEVILSTNNRTIRYFIDSIQIISPTEMEILDPTPGPTLTLVTCYPFEFIGHAPMRYIIRGTPREGAVAAGEQ